AMRSSRTPINVAIVNRTLQRIKSVRTAAPGTFAPRFNRLLGSTCPSHTPSWDDVDRHFLVTNFRFLPDRSQPADDTAQHRRVKDLVRGRIAHPRQRYGAYSGSFRRTMVHEK